MPTNLTAYVPSFSFLEILPFALLTVAGLLVLALDALLDFLKGMTPAKRDRILAICTGATLIATATLFYFDVMNFDGTPFLEDAFRADTFANLSSLTILFAALMFVIMSPSLLVRRKLPAGEVYALLLFATLGMVMLSVSNELITAFISIEILSLSLYVLAGVDRRSRKSSEASFKYFILGAFASAFLVMGIAFLFGATGTTKLTSDGVMLRELQANGTNGSAYLERPSYDLAINEVLTAGERVVYASYPGEVVDGQVNEAASLVVTTEPINPMWLFIGFGLLFVGMCFKLSLAPFHMWAPDVYEGAPTLTAMMIATASKVAAFAFLVRVLDAMSPWELFPQAASFLLAAVAVASIAWGNFAALVQTNIKRMLAYSSIAHGGYLTIGVLTLIHPEVLGEAGRIDRVRDALAFYLFAYTLMNVLAFGVVAYLGREGEGEIRNYRGLFKRRPFLAAGLAIAMISLIGLGIPGTVGFWGKYYVFKEAINAGFVALAIVAMIGSAVSAFYYLRVVQAMFMQPEETDRTPAGAVKVPQFGYAFVLSLSSALIFIFGFLPPLFLAFGGR